MATYQLDQLDDFGPFPGLTAKLVHAEGQTLAFWTIEKDAVLPEHSHVHQQIVVVTEGELEMTVSDQKQVLKPGSVLVIPPHAPHSAIALTPVKVTDVFHPGREDFPQ